MKAVSAPGKYVRRFPSRGSSTKSRDRPRLSPPAGKPGLGQRLVTALKEWGGVATLLIAILYTFPSTVLDRVTSSEEKELARARQALSEGSSMMIERLLNAPKITDVRATDMMNNLYNVKFYNLIYTNSDLLARNRGKLRSSELAIMAGLLAFSGNAKEALIYFDAAIARAKSENVPYVNILRDKAQVLMYPGPTQDLALGRKSYVDVLGFFANEKHPMAARQHALFLAELALFEATVGDWACGQALKADAENALQIVQFRDPSVAPFYTIFTENFSGAKQGDTQPTDGCGYKSRSRVGDLERAPPAAPRPSRAQAARRPKAS
jgi:hypothetical protein